ncbi:MAG: ribosomal protein S18-alanine N-acetyltransferase [Dermatophilaceae bacterium]
MNGAPGIRPMGWTDIDALVALEAELFADDAWSAASWWAELAQRPRRDYVVAGAGAGIAGYAGLDLAGDVADVMTIAVAPWARGSGLGDRLLGHLEARAVQAGAEAILLEVRADNAPARRLYDRHGYAVLQTRRKYYQPGDVDALVLRKLLPGKEIGS